MLGQKYRVHAPATAYNTSKSVHLEVFDQKFATTPLGWFRVSAKMLVLSMRKANFDVLVVEIGTDHPGEMRDFAYLRPHIGVLTAITPEHMEFFETIEAVAAEELVVAEYCDKLVINKSAVQASFVPDTVSQTAVWYGDGTDYRPENYRFNSKAASSDVSVTADFTFGRYELRNVQLKVIGEHSLQALTAAGTVGVLCGLTVDQIAAGLRSVEPVCGRMQLLRGINSSIIDDSYNSSPEACKAALDTLYRLEVAHRIAVLGTMNEMGGYSPQAHREVGMYCDPAVLGLVVTIGKEAEEFLGAAARERGCTVKSFMSPYEAGKFIREHLRQLPAYAAILVKGSQNQVFAEESIKAFLADPADEAKLVRQSEFWMRRKRQQFDATEER